MSIDLVLNHSIREILGEEHKSSTFDTFLEAAQDMRKAGMDDDSIFGILSSLRGAVGDEYGD